MRHFRLRLLPVAVLLCAGCGRVSIHSPAGFRCDDPSVRADLLHLQQTREFKPHTGVYVLRWTDSGRIMVLAAQHYLCWWDVHQLLPRKADAVDHVHIPVAVVGRSAYVTAIEGYVWHETFQSVDAALSAIRKGSANVPQRTVYWTLSRPSPDSLAPPWHIVRRDRQDNTKITVTPCSSGYELTRLVTPRVVLPEDPAIRARVHPYGRENSKTGLIAGEYILQTDLGCHVHILTVQQLAFRKKDWSYAGSADFGRPELGQLVVIGTESQERFNSIADAIAAIDQGPLTTMPGLASWDVPATATPRFLVYSTKGRE